MWRATIASSAYGARETSGESDDDKDLELGIDTKTRDMAPSSLSTTLDVMGDGDI